VACDENPVGAFAAERGDPPLGDRVHPRRLRSCKHHVNADRGEHRVEGGGELDVAVTNQVRETTSRVLQIRGQIASQLAAQAPVGWEVTPSKWTRRLPCSITKAAYRRFNVTVSTWEKSTASRPPAWARRNVRHASPRPEGPGTPRPRRIRRIVDAATRCPSRRSSPWTRTTPQVRFSVARRTISAVISSLTRGRPTDFGWRHFPATSRRCHRSNVAGVTRRRSLRDCGRSRARAASTARSAQPSRGQGFVRRSTATS
jgi:hypothetical protein